MFGLVIDGLSVLCFSHSIMLTVALSIRPLNARDFILPKMKILELVFWAIFSRNSRFFQIEIEGKF